jgi:xylan 1,4-beta-xylosidase
VEGSDAVVLVVGLDQSQEREGVDRSSLALPAVQMDLIEAVLQAAAGKPVALVVETGGSVCLAKYKDDPRVSSILVVGYPGQAGGQGVSDALFGRFSPSGRLTQTFYGAQFADEVSFYDYRMRPAPADETTGDIGSPGRGYRFYEGEHVVYPFGAGLSYTDFVYDWHDQCRAARMSVVVKEGGVSALLHVRATNVGLGARQVYDGPAADTILLFLEPPAHVDFMGVPMRVLRGFEKVMVEPDTAEEVSFHLTDEDFSLADAQGVTTLIRGEWTARVGKLTKTLVIQ